jgi:hypothetical protein
VAKTKKKLQFWPSLKSGKQKQYIDNEMVIMNFDAFGLRLLKV